MDHSVYRRVITPTPNTQEYTALNVIPLKDYRLRKQQPLLTWTLVVLSIVIFLWDRDGSFVGSSRHFPDLVLRPNQVIDVARGGDPMALATLFTSIFLHGSAVHLFGNLIFLSVFGPSVEDALASTRFGLYFLAWGISGWLVHIFVDMSSAIPTLGASGAISGVMGAYFVLFPSDRIKLGVPWFPFIGIPVPAWLTLTLWFGLQVVLPKSGVAIWAHLGGFLAGMVTILVLGGRQGVLNPKGLGPLDRLNWPFMNKQHTPQEPKG